MNESKQFSFSRSFLHGELTIGAWTLIQKSIGVVSIYFILDALTLYQYGVYQLLLAGYALVAGLFLTLFQDSVTNDIARSIARAEEGKSKRLFFEYALFRTGMGAIPFLITFAIAPYLSSSFGPDAILWIRILSILFIIETLETLSLTLLKLRLDFRTAAKAPAIEKFSQALILAAFAVVGRLSIAEVVAAQVAASIVALLFLLRPTVAQLRSWNKIRAASGSLLPDIIRTFGKWEIPQTLVRDAGVRIRPWLLKFFLGTEAVGVFGVANTAVDLLKNFIPRQTLATLIPRTIENREYTKMLSRVLGKYYLLAGGALAFLGAGVFPLTVYFLFPKFGESVSLFLLLALSIPAYTYGKLIGAFLIAWRRQRFIFISRAVQSIASLVFLIAFIPLFGILGTAVAEILALTGTTMLVYRHLVQGGFLMPLAWGELVSYTADDKKLIALLTRRFRRFAHTRQAVG